MTNLSMHHYSPLQPSGRFLQTLALRRELEAIEPTATIPRKKDACYAQWHGHDPTQDRWVVDAPDTPDKFIAYAWVFAQSQERVVTFIRCIRLGVDKG